MVLVSGSQSNGFEDRWVSGLGSLDQNRTIIPLESTTDAITHPINTVWVGIWRCNLKDNFFIGITARETTQSLAQIYSQH